MALRIAARSRSKLRIGMSGPPGSGKTYSALLLASGLTSWDKIALLDSENGRGELYSHLGHYNYDRITAPFTPEKYIAAIKECEDAGMEVIIIDSVSHEWEGEGGCLEINDRLAKAKYKGNTWAAFSETTPRHQAFIRKIITSNCHIITTVRNKVETAQEGGKVKKVGTKEIQREGFEYELTLNFSLEREKHMAIAGKDNTELFDSRDPFVISPADGEELLKWVNEGVERKEEVVPVKNEEKKIKDSITDQINKEWKKWADFNGKKPAIMFETIKASLNKYYKKTQLAQLSLDELTDFLDKITSLNNKENPLPKEEEAPPLVFEDVAPPDFAVGGEVEHPEIAMIGENGTDCTIPVETVEKVKAIKIAAKEPIANLEDHAEVKKMPPHVQGMARMIDFTAQQEKPLETPKIEVDLSNIKKEGGEIVAATLESVSVVKDPLPEMEAKIKTPAREHQSLAHFKEQADFYSNPKKLMMAAEKMTHAEELLAFEKELVEAFTNGSDLTASTYGQVMAILAPKTAPYRNRVKSDIQ